MNPESRGLQMRVIANLSNSEDNKVLMMVHSGLLSAVFKIAALDNRDRSQKGSQRVGILTFLHH